MTHDFPETPEITYPEDGTTDVSMAPTITWEALNNIDSLYMYIEGDNEFELGIELSKDATSYTFPSGLLQSNTKYDFTLVVKINDGKDNDLFTSRVVYFTTGSE